MEEKIVNVLTTDTSKAELLFDDSFNIITDLKDAIDGRPTLILGWQLAKKTYPEDASILNWRIKRYVYWTYEPNVRTMNFIRDVFRICQLVG